MGESERSLRERLSRPDDPGPLRSLLRCEGALPRLVVEAAHGAVFVLGVQAPPPTVAEDWPVDWAPAWHRELANQERLLWLEGPHGERVVLPHVVELGPWGPRQGGEVEVRGLRGDRFFVPRRLCKEGAAFWDAHAVSLRMRKPYDPREGNARLVRCETRPPALSFEPVRYTHYVATNLSLDRPLSSGDTLRRESFKGGRLEALHQSELANTVGTGVLLFSSDGALILQHRSSGKVLFRAHEVCAGGSGTLDWSDIQRCPGGRLESLDLFREAWEEVGVQQARRPELLGLTRELVRLDPGLWMAADVDESAAEILGEWVHRRPDDEGRIFALHLGEERGRASPHSPLDPAGFWELVGHIAEVGAPAVPLLANLALWWLAADPSRGGVVSMAELRG